MVRTIVLAGITLLLAVPAFAQFSQDDYPRIEMAMGYANLAFPSFSTFNSIEHHSGFSTHMGFNLSRKFGIENYTGIYGLGQGVTLISNIVGGKIMWRKSRVVPFAVGGIGIGYFTASSGGYYSSSSSFATRYGGGADIPFNDSMGLKIDVSRLGSHGDIPRSLTGNSWITNWNISTGINFTLSN